jgi:hypothetical protein
LILNTSVLLRGGDKKARKLAEGEKEEENPV